VRRTVFRDQAVELSCTFNESAAVAARFESLSASTQALERANASHVAELAADQRLHHVVKGRCGSAISAVETFRELLGPFLKQDLSSEMADLLIAPIGDLREAIQWCHRRQVFVQLEKGVYLSRHTAVNINQLLRSRLGSAGALHAEISEALALDETVLTIAFDEVLSNALKYRKKRTPLRTFARFAQGVLHVSLENDNPDEFVPLTPEECERVFLPCYKSHTCSAMSDGLGLDSVSCAVRAAAGTVRLELSVASTIAHIWLPATLRESSSQQPTPQASRRVVSSVAVVHDPSPPDEPNVSPRFGGDINTSDANSEPTKVSLRAIGTGALRPRCVGLTSGSGLQPRFFSDVFSHLDAGEATVLIASLSAYRRFPDVVFGSADAPADIVLLDHTLVALGGGSFKGVHAAMWLRQLGFRGLIGILCSGQSADAEAETDPVLDAILLDFGSGIESICQSLRQRHVAIMSEKPVHVAPCMEAPGGDVRTGMAAMQVGDSGARSRTVAQLCIPPASCDVGEGGGESSVQACPVPSSQERWEESANASSTGQTCTESPLAPPQPHWSATVAKPTPDASAPAVKAAAACGLRVVGLDDEKIPRMVQGLFMMHHLGANMQESCTLGETREEMLAVVDVALGVLHADLTPNSGERRQADVVLLDENIMPPGILGSRIASELRDRGFTGVIVLLTGATSAYLEEIRSIPAVDFVRYSPGGRERHTPRRASHSYPPVLCPVRPQVFDKGTSLPMMAELIFKHETILAKDLPKPTASS